MSPAIRERQDAYIRRCIRNPLRGRQLVVVVVSDLRAVRHGCVAFSLQAQAPTRSRRYLKFGFRVEPWAPTWQVAPGVWHRTMRGNPRQKQRRQNRLARTIAPSHGAEFR